MHLTDKEYGLIVECLILTSKRPDVGMDQMNELLTLAQKVRLHSTPEIPPAGDDLGKGKKK